jgi:hypothetical protein
MRKLNWDEPLSEEDFAFIRQSGIPGLMERAETHQAKFGAKVPEDDTPEDTLTQSALDPQGRTATPVPHTGPQLVDPTAPPAVEEVPAEDAEGDDYDSWSKADLEDEVTARNALANTSQVEVHGTGKNGNVLAVDLVKGLRLWDQENPEALKG